MNKFGFITHYVPDDPESPTKVNAHTHGLPESFGHKDIQIVLPLPPKDTHMIIHGLVREIKEGKKFESYIEYSEVIENYKIKFIDAIECGRPVLRLIFPDNEGNLDSKHELYRKQYECTNVN